VNEELETIWKEAVVAYSGEVIQHVLGGKGETTKIHSDYGKFSVWDSNPALRIRNGSGDHSTEISGNWGQRVRV